MRVVELIPPAIDTGLAGDGGAHGAPVDTFCDEVFPKIVAGQADIGFGVTSSPDFQASKTLQDQLFDMASGRFSVKRFEPAESR